MNAFWRTCVVAFLMVFYIATTLPDVILPWHPTGSFGFYTDGSGKIGDVVPGSAAERAGLRRGDRVDFAATPFESRRYLQTSPDVAQPGSRAAFVFERAGVARAYVLAADPIRRSLADNVTDIVAILSIDLVALIAAWLVLKRPSRMTWAFFLYGIGTPGLSVVFISVVPAAVILAMYAIEAFVAFQCTWLFLFALRFPNDRAAGRRAIAERAVLATLPIAIALNFWGTAGYLLAIPPPAWLGQSYAVLNIVGLLAASATFVATYVTAKHGDKPRIRWVMVGLVVGYAGQFSETLLINLLPGFVVWPLWVSNLTYSLQLCVAIAVAYAVIRHRVFDVRFFIGRAVVYAAVTGLVVSLLSLIDLAAGKMLAGTGLAAIGEAGLAVLVGLGLSGVHKRIERFVDATLFRSRTEAQARLHRIGRGLGHAASIEGIEHTIVHEPASAFGLTSAASFRRDESGDFVRGAAAGWEQATLERIGREDPVVLQLLGAHEPLAMRHARFMQGTLPGGEHRPSYALPIVIRSTLEAIVLYGPHQSNEELDPAEIETLERLLHEAAAAFDHVRADAVAERLAELEAQVAQLRGLRAVQ